MQVCVVVSTISQAGVIGNQGGSSNLQWFEARYPPALKGEEDSMVAIRCFRLVGKDTSTVVDIIAQAREVAATIAWTNATVG